MTESRKSMDSISHGRGGYGNIGVDDTPYGDGEITREGYVGEGGVTGRGGAANMSPAIKPIKHTNHDKIPDEALRPSMDSDGHVGRGGAGNEAAGPEKAEETLHHVGLADKLKNKLFKSKKVAAA